MDIVFSFIFNAIIWTLAIYGLIEIIRTIICICIHTNMRNEGIYMVIAVKNQENDIEGIMRSIVFKILYGKEESIKDIIITDLNSDDGTKEILKRLEKEYDCINLIDWKECKDMIDAVNNS